MKLYFLPLFLLLGFTLSFGQATLEVISEKANVRSSANARASVVATLNQGILLEIVEKRGAWYKVKSSNNVGWVHGTSVRAVFPVLPVPHAYGDPNSRWGDLSTGPGSGGGIGTGRGQGAGTGSGGQGTGIGTGSGQGSGTSSIINDYPSNSEMRFVDKPRAVYTDIARRNGVQGNVKLKVTFLASGEIGEIVPITFLPDGLTEQAVAAAKRIRFRPKLVNGVPKTVTRLIEYNFTVY